MTKIIGEFIVLAGLAVLRAFALATLWSWFVVPLGAASVSMAGALGLVLILRAVGLKGIEPNEDLKEFYEVAIFNAMVSMIAIGTGYIIHLFM